LKCIEVREPVRPSSGNRAQTLHELPQFSLILEKLNAHLSGGADLGYANIERIFLAIIFSVLKLFDNSRPYKQEISFFLTWLNRMGFYGSGR
jgi:hypothetical protein